MDAVVPWSRLVSIIGPQCPKACLRGGRPPISLGDDAPRPFSAKLIGLCDPGAEDALLDIEPMRTFAGIEFGIHRIPDETTILKFHRLPAKHDLTEKLFKEVNQLLEGTDRGGMRKVQQPEPAKIDDGPGFGFRI